MKTQTRTRVNLAAFTALSLLLVTMAACSNNTANSGDASSSRAVHQSADTDASPAKLPPPIESPVNQSPPKVNPCDPTPYQNYTPEQVGQRAAACHGGTVMLAQQVTLEQVASMGLGCYNFASIETPPLVLVILKGNFMSGGGSGYSVPGGQSTAKYIALVYDMWAGTPTIVVDSPNGGGFRKALNDPTLPDDAAPGAPTPMTIACPPSTSGKHLHYGQTAPGMIFPTPTPAK